MDDIADAEHFVVDSTHYSVPARFLLERQERIKWEHRAVVVDWMMEITTEIGFKRETFHLAVNYLDRYLNRVPNVERQFVQLIAVAAVQLAAKFEEIHVPSIKFYVHATANSFDAAQIMKMEERIACQLEWRLSPQTLNAFL